MTQDNDQVLLPSSYVNKLFDTVKESSDHNTVAIRELTSALSGLTILLTAPPTHTEIHTKLKEHDSEIKLKDKEENTEVTKRFNGLDEKLDAVKHKMTVVLIVISVVFSLAITAYLFVKSSIDYQIVNAVNSETKVIMEQNVKDRNQILYEIERKIEELKKEK